MSPAISLICAFSKVLPLWFCMVIQPTRSSKIGLICGAVGNYQVVVGVPVHAAADVGNFGVEFAGLVGLRAASSAWA